MNIGMIGLGKLGLPVSIALCDAGYKVIGYDVSPKVKEAVETKIFPHVERGYRGTSIQSMFDKSNITLASIADIVKQCDVVFVAVQTPHAPHLDGTHPLTDERSDFDYTYLVSAIKEIVSAANGRSVTLAVISTVAPGTYERILKPLIPDNICYSYTPQFIAMGTVIQDFFEPEFSLYGYDERMDQRVVDVLQHVARNDAPVLPMKVKEAELVKMGYNGMIGLKILYANMLMEMAHRMGGIDVDTVTHALKISSKRLTSPAYMSGGMGDSGACHPRDALVLSQIARDLDMDYDVFTFIMSTREKQARYLCDLMMKYNLPKAIIGYAYKPDTKLIDGSSALLCKNILEHEGYNVTLFDPLIDATTRVFDTPHVYLIGQRHTGVTYPFPDGSIVIDPFRDTITGNFVKHIRVGA